MFILCILLIRGWPAPGQGALSEKSQVFVGHLREQYGGNVYQAFRPAGPVRLADLPIVLQVLVSKADGARLDAACRESCATLNNRKPAYWRNTIFLSAASKAGYQAKLETDVRPAGETVLLLGRAVNEVYAYLDWYAGDDWHRRFGDNGFYETLRGLREQMLFCSASYLFLAGTVEEGTATRYEGAIRDVSGQIEALIGKKQFTAEALGQARLRRIRLHRLLVQHDKTTTAALREDIEDALATTDAPDLRYEIRLEALHLATIAGGRDELRGELTLFNKWLEDNRGRLSDYPGKKLHLLLWEYETSAADAARTKSFIERLYRFAWLHPALSREIVEIVGDLMGRTIGSRPADPHLNQAWDDFAWLSLARHYQRVEDDRLAGARSIYEALLRTRPKEQPMRPLVLLQLGRLQLRETGGDDYGTIPSFDPNVPEDRERWAAALSIWQQLISDHPDWTSALHPVMGQLFARPVSAGDIAAIAAARAWALYEADKDTYRQVAVEQLTLLVGTVAGEAPGLSGPFAADERSRAMRFHLGWLHFEAKRHIEAAAYFATVPEDDPHYEQAVYSGVFCRKQIADRQQLPSTAYRRQADGWIGELEALLPDVKNESLAVEGTLLLGELYEKTGRTAAALRLYDERLRTCPNHEALVTASQKALSDLWPRAYRLFAEDKTMELDRLLPTAVSLGELTLRQGAEAGAELSRFSRRNFLQYALMYSLVLPDEARGYLAEAERLLAEAVERSDGARPLWLVRCRAQLRFVRGDYIAAQQDWYQIRQATRGHDDPLIREYWWEARYYSLRCLIARGEQEQAGHILEVLFKTQAESESFWKERLAALLR